MEPIFVTGHKNPDTDSIVSAMAYSALQNALGQREYVPARLGPVNDETQKVLDTFGFTPPLPIANVRTQVRDLEFDTPSALNERLTIHLAWNVFEEDASLSSLPVTDDAGRLQGMLTRGDIAAFDMEALNNRTLKDVSVFNVLAALEGNLVNQPKKQIDSLNGDVVIALPATGSPTGMMREGCIAIMGAQEDMFQAAVQSKASCIVLCQAEYTDKLKALSEDTAVIYTPLDAYRACRLLYLSAPISRVLNHDSRLVVFHMEDYIDDVRKMVLENRFHAYPIVDKNQQVMGTLSRYHLINPRRKKVVLVDHNEMSQSVPGLEQADIAAVIDHHRLADVQTLSPVYMRNEPVGSTNTIIATMFQEKGLVPGPKLAGLMAAAIASDTVMFKSPTCTERDVAMAERLCRIAGLTIKNLGDIIFTSDSGERTAEDFLLTDYKEFHIAGHSIGIGQVTCIDSDKVLLRKQELLSLMKKVSAEKGHDMVMLMVTDVLKEGTALLYLGEDDIIRQAFSVEANDHEVFLPHVISRKKQIVPALSLLWG